MTDEKKPAEWAHALARKVTCAHGSPNSEHLERLKTQADALARAFEAVAEEGARKAVSTIMLRWQLPLTEKDIERGREIAREIGLPDPFDDVEVRLAEAARIMGDGGPVPEEPPETTMDPVAAPCVFCGYNGAGYWQAQTHAKNCPWFAIRGADERRDRLRFILAAGAFAEKQRERPECSDAIRDLWLWAMNDPGFRRRQTQNDVPCDFTVNSGPKWDPVAAVTEIRGLLERHLARRDG